MLKLPNAPIQAINTLTLNRVFKVFVDLFFLCAQSFCLTHHSPFCCVHYQQLYRHMDTLMSKNWDFMTPPCPKTGTLWTLCAHFQDSYPTLRIISCVRNFYIASTNLYNEVINKKPIRMSAAKTKSLPSVHRSSLDLRLIPNCSVVKKTINLTMS
jgi:hypothetical protein